MVTISPILNLWDAIGSSTSADDGVTHGTFTAPWEIRRNQVAALVQLKPVPLAQLRVDSGLTLIAAEESQRSSVVHHSKIGRRGQRWIIRVRPMQSAASSDVRF